MIAVEDLRIAAPGFALCANWRLDGPGHTAVIGPSGAGKSTLLEVLAGFRKPAAGRVWMQGADVTGRAPADRPAAMLFQDNNLFPHLSLLDNLRLVLRPRGGRLTAAERARITDLLAELGLGALDHRLPGSLSGGQRGRAALARALLQDKPILLLDEPFAALGPALRAEMLDLVKRSTAQRGARALLVTHNPREAQDFAQRTLLVADGKAHAPQDTRTLFADPPAALRRYLGPGMP